MRVRVRHACVSHPKLRFSAEDILHLGMTKGLLMGGGMEVGKIPAYWNI